MCARYCPVRDVTGRDMASVASRKPNVCAPVMDNLDGGRKDCANFNLGWTGNRIATVWTGVSKDTDPFAARSAGAEVRCLHRQSSGPTIIRASYVNRHSSFLDTDPIFHQPDCECPSVSGCA